MAGSDPTNILIVDDLPETVLAYQSILEELGENLVVARSGPEALKHVLTNDFAVILLDVSMPGMDGFETAQLIRQRKSSAHTPIIFLTAFADEVRVAQGYASGAVDYIPTPPSPAILRAKVRVFVELQRMRRQVARQAEEQARRAAAEESARRFAFLADASRALASSLDVEATLRTLALLPLPTLADAALVVLADEQGGAGRGEYAWAGANPGAPVRPHDRFAAAVTRVLAGGGLERLGPLDPPAPLAEGAAGPAADVALVLPLAARGRILGALALGRGRAEDTFTAEDVALAEELAGRAGVALDNARLVHAIQEADRRKDEFLAMLAHELRNPLAPVRNAVEILRLRAPEQPDLIWARDVIDRQIAHLTRLVDDLLDVSRITRGKVKLKPEPLEVADVVAGAVETSRPLIESHGHQLTVSQPPGPLRVNADPARLSQVLANLLNNAAKYTPDGGRIWLEVGREGDAVLFRVRDSGTGIPAEMLSKVFDLFTQVDHSLDRSQGGLGIGLTLVQRLVEMHGGSVQAFSDGPGRGSEFVVRLPALADADAGGEWREAAATSSPALHPHALRVLVVDDNVDGAESLAMLLRLRGHDVQLAHDGNAALEAARSANPEVIILDIGLPGLDGHEVARRLRADPATRDAVLIAISGYGRDENRRLSLQAGFDHHLVKPVELAALEKLLLLERQAAIP